MDPSSDRNYRKVPHFSIHEMKDDFELQNISELIERALCIIDEEKNIDDSLALKFIELLLDKYYFKDEPVVFKNDFEKEGFMFIDGHIDKNFSEIPTEIIYKVLGAILRSIKRHTNGKKEYLAFAHQFISL